MGSSEAKRILAGFGIATLLAGVALTGCKSGGSVIGFQERCRRHRRAAEAADRLRRADRHRRCRKRLRGQEITGAVRTGHVRTRRPGTMRPGPPSFDTFPLSI